MRKNLRCAKKLFAMLGVSAMPFFALAQDWQEPVKVAAYDRVRTTPAVTQPGFGQTVDLQGVSLYIKNAVGVMAYGPYKQYSEEIPYWRGSLIGVNLPSTTALMARSSGLLVVTDLTKAQIIGSSTATFTSPVSGGIAAVAADPGLAAVAVKTDNLDWAGQNPVANAGAVYIYRLGVRTPGQWDIEMKVTAPVRTPNGNFGLSAAISGDQLMVGTPDSVMIFSKNKGGTSKWGHTQSIAGPRPAGTVGVKNIVAMKGDYAIITALFEGSAAATSPGSAVIYKRNAKNRDLWQLVQQLTLPDPVNGAPFADQLSFDGTTFAVGVPSFGAFPRRAFVFPKSAAIADRWEPGVQLVPVEYTPDFARSISVSLDLVAVATKNMPFSGYGDQVSGAVHLFQRSEGGPNAWGTERVIYEIQQWTSDLYGSSVFVNDDLALVNAPRNDFDVAGDYDTDAGAVYMLQKGPEGWKNKLKINSPQRDIGTVIDDRFGSAFAIQDTIMVIGAPNEGRPDDVGGVYVYSKNKTGAGKWGLISKHNIPRPSYPLNYSNDDSKYGFALALSESMMVVGAVNDKYQTNQPYDYSFVTSGSAFVYERSATANSGFRYVKRLVASRPNPSASFGASVAQSGDYILVGAKDDDYDLAEGNALNSAGSAYLYGRNVGGTDNWGLIRKIVNDVRAKNDQFGIKVGMSGDYAIISSTDGKGSVTILKKDLGGAGNWGVLKKISLPENTGRNLFGYAASLKGDIIVVGAYDLKGATYVYRKDLGGADNWGLQQVLTANISRADDRFGFAVATDGKTVLVGAPYNDTNAEDKDHIFNAGAIYFFESSQPVVNTVRVNAGGAAFNASAGRTFTEDQYFSGTNKVSSYPTGDILNTTDDALYQDVRAGASINYKIPLSNGNYNVILHFAEIFWGVPGRGGSTATNKRRFNVDIEGSRKLTNYDISVAAGGAMRARQETFAVTLSDGTLNIDFGAGASDNPLIAAIEIVPAATQTILGPVADAYVRNFPNDAVNYGTAPTIEVKEGSLPSYERISFLKFGLGNISGITSAKLRVYGKNVQNANAATLSVAAVDSDSWTETGITWANKPASGSILGTALVDNVAGYREIDVTSFVQAQLAGDKTAGFALRDAGLQNIQLTFNSRENPEFQPQLIIQSGGAGNASVRLFEDKELLSGKTESARSTIYPNPAGRRFTVSLSPDHTGGVNFQMTSITGKAQPVRNVVPSNAGTVEVNLNGAEFPGGMYLFKIQSQRKTEVIKVILTD